MFRISKENLITMSRGDSGVIPVTLNIGTKFNPELHPLNFFDEVYLGITEPNKPFEEAIIRKSVKGIDHYTETEVSFNLTPLDTEYLLPGTYYYSIKLLEYIDEENYNVYTIIDKRKFTIVD